jgi:hypothetical protein
MKPPNFVLAVDGHAKIIIILITLIKALCSIRFHVGYCHLLFD